MLRSLALLVTPVAVYATAGDLGAACATNACTAASTKNTECRDDGSGSDSKCRCKANMVPGAAADKACVALDAAKMKAGGIVCANATFAEGVDAPASATDFSKNTQCPSSGNAADKVICADNAVLVTSTGKCTPKASVAIGTEVEAGGANDAARTGAAGLMWAKDDIASPLGVSTKDNKLYIDCEADKYMSNATTCTAQSNLVHGGACYIVATGKTPESDKTLVDNNFQCLPTTGNNGAGKLACATGAVDNGAGACLVAALGVACDSAGAGTPSGAAGAGQTTNAAHTYTLPAGYICPATTVNAVANVSPAKPQNQLACAEKFVPCQKTGNSNVALCSATCTTADIKLEGYCQSDTQCTKASDGAAALPTGTGKCLLQTADQSKRCGCAKAMAVGGATCLATSTINNAIATANVCESDKKSFQTFAEGYTCVADKIACDASSSLDATTGALKLGYMLNAAGTGCSQWNGDISKAQACKTDSAVDAFAKNAECKGATVGCPTTGNTTVCAMNKAMCGKAPTDAVKSTCQCPFAMHKAAKSDDPDFDDKACIATIVGATCSAVPAETFPASNPSNSYACTSNKIACAATHLECKNAGPMKGRCIAKDAISSTTADQTAAKLAKAYTLCPTTKAPTTAAPSAASGLAIPALAALVAIAFA